MARTSYKPPKPKSTSTSSPNVKMARSSGYGPSGGYSVTQKTSMPDPSRFGYGTSKYDQFLEDSVASTNQRVPSAGRRSKASVLAASNKKYEILYKIFFRTLLFRALTPSKSRLAKVLPSSCRNCSTSYPVEWAKVGLISLSVLYLYFSSVANAEPGASDNLHEQKKIFFYDLNRLICKIPSHISIFVLSKN